MKKLLALIGALALLLAAAGAETAGRELSEYYGQDIAQAAEALGGLSFWAGDEFAENYECDTLALRGNGGKVADIELKAVPGPDSLCGVTVGMARSDVLALMNGHPLLWEYDEEVAYIVREDTQNELNSETLVVFFDEDAAVNGAWYRASAG